jgi:fermentation-respiration switch protein FrsA (DUF1100 family)
VAAPGLSRADRRRVRLWVLAVIAGIIAAGGPLLLRALERRLILFPSPPVLDRPPPALGAEEAWFEAPDGSKLHGWFVPGEGDTAILMAHGNAGDVSSRANQIDRLHRVTGLPVMLFDYRGYGKSEGSPTLVGLVEDGLAARAWLAARVGVPADQLILQGRSLGGGVMSVIAAKHGARGLILVNTFSSLADASTHHMPWVPARWLLSEPLDSERALSRWPGPVLQAHATNDEVVPFELGERLHRAAAGPKRFVPMPGQVHNDAMPTSWDDEVRQFVDELEVAP